MSVRIADLHADWLRLVEPEGQFLSLPVLRRAFPDGLDTVATATREQIRDRYPHDTAPSQAQWDVWIDWLLRDALAWGSYYRTGEDAAAYMHAVPEQGIVLRADGALCDPETGKPRVLVVRYQHGMPLDRRLAGERWNASPLDRLTLLCRTQGVRIGLVTDGERIVLASVPRSGTGGCATYDTSLFTESRERNFLQSFVSLLHASRFFAVQQNVQLEALFEASGKAQDEVTGQLGLQVRQAVELLVAALSRANLERGGRLLAGIVPQTVYQAAATVMMRLVFLLYAEERDLLPLSDPFYVEYYAASTLREQLDEQAAVEGDEPLERRGAAWYRLLALFRAIYCGLNHDRLRIPPYGGRLFDPDRFAFLEGRSPGESWVSVASCPLPVDDLTVRAILAAIQTVPIRESGLKERRRLSFRSLDVEQIGHVYEGLLDHGAVRVDDVHVGLVGKTGDEAEIPLADLEKAAGQGQQPLVSFLHEITGKSDGAIQKLIERGRAVAEGKDGETRRQINTVCDNNAALAARVSPFVYTLRADLHGLPVVFPPESLVVKQTRARRDSGTEYTPRELAEEMVRYALEPLVYSPGPRDGVGPEKWQLRSSKELLGLKLCDPTVGSGAFLVSACRYLADRVVEAWIFEDSNKGMINCDDLTLEARRAVVDRCLYGVDRDPMAVEMAKLSLWLITMARERPFSFLDHAIREGDSLLGITALDQLRFLHVDPEVGRVVHKRMHLDVTAVLQPLVERAVLLRQELEALPSLTVRDSEQKQQLNDEANRLLEQARVIADGVVATAISTATLTQQKRNAAFQGLALLVASALDSSKSEEKRLDELERLRSRTDQMLNAGRPESAAPRTTLHWPLVFPEVIGRGNHRFDAIIGNPPFMGCKYMSGSIGTDFRAYLVSVLADGEKGRADLVAYFFLRASTLASSVALLATQTISEGATGVVGLNRLLAADWSIVRAVKSRPWPGAAGVYIAQLWLVHAGQNTPQTRILDGVSVSFISASLQPASGPHSERPKPLHSNVGLAFNGAYIMGDGFFVSPEETGELLERDKKYADVLFPFLDAEDLCNQPNGLATRHIINFFDWSYERAREYVDCFRRVEVHVKPYRESFEGERYTVAREKWWIYWGRRPAMQSALRRHKQVIVMPIVSKVALPLMYPTDFVFGNKVTVIAIDDLAVFGVMTSTPHRLWVRRYSTTREKRTNYVPAACFDTFPFPRNMSQVIDQIKALSLIRSETMGSLKIGLTSLYNKVHDPGVDTNEFRRLRATHERLDRAVCDAYGWVDVDLAYGFYDTVDEGSRWTIDEAARIQILNRLLELNHERHREEVARGAAIDPVTNSNGRSKVDRGVAQSDQQISLIGEHGDEANVEI